MAQKVRSCYPAIVVVILEEKQKSTTVRSPIQFEFIEQVPTHQSDLTLTHIRGIVSLRDVSDQGTYSSKEKDFECDVKNHKRQWQRYRSRQR